MFQPWCCSWTPGAWEVPTRKKRHVFCDVFSIWSCDWAALHGTRLSHAAAALADTTPLWVGKRSVPSKALDGFLETLPDLPDLTVSLHFVGRNMSSSICWFMISRNWNGSTNFLATPIYSWFMYVHKWWSEMSVSNHDSTIQYPFHENCHELSSWWKLNGNYM